MHWGGVMAGHMGWGVIEEEVWRKGPWTAEEDRLLIEYVRLHGEGRWNSVARLAGEPNFMYSLWMRICPILVYTLHVYQLYLVMW